MANCRNTHYAHECHPSYAARYDGYCLDCWNAGVPELVERVQMLHGAGNKVERLEAEAARLRAENDELRKSTPECPDSGVALVETDVCLKFECQHWVGALLHRPVLIVVNGYRTCPVCKASYGESIPPGAAP